ncbi:HAD hydrolase-like protein [Rhodocytophaga rosea]|uniref:HAD hydrolase-like protein n=1 Tax=Rhodocytophaga rosea TaxID=2704465 RepID=A0A6C0GRQ6_9BACT|nr:HAD hydrolase-like protein [Rhodocytophaga rosea]QHT70771.1 HAD hydrolase-like protein [Rhodocytophaga rosea]
MKQYILFDFDGTLVDSRQSALTIFNQLADKYHFKHILPEDIEPLRKLSLLQRCRFLKLPIYKIPFIVREARLLYRSHLQNICLFEGIKPMLEELTKRHFTLAVLSSNSESNIQTILQKNHIDTIDSIIAGSTLFSKQTLIKKFIKVNKLHPSQLIYVGDELRDVIACKKSGVPIIWVSWAMMQWKL